MQRYHIPLMPTYPLEVDGSFAKALRTGIETLHLYCAASSIDFSAVEGKVLYLSRDQVYDYLEDIGIETLAERDERALSTYDDFSVLALFPRFAVRSSRCIPFADVHAALDGLVIGSRVIDVQIDLAVKFPSVAFQDRPPEKAVLEFLLTDEVEKYSPFLFLSKYI